MGGTKIIFSLRIITSNQILFPAFPLTSSGPLGHYGKSNMIARCPLMEAGVAFSNLEVFPEDHEIDLCRDEKSIDLVNI